MSKIKSIWKKNGKTINAEGRTIIYIMEGTTYTIESRLRHVPHANRVGTWDHTTYHLFKGGTEVKVFYSLADAKAFAELAINPLN